MASATLTGVIKLNTGNMSKGLAAMKKSLQSFRRDVAAPFAEAAREASRFTKMVALAAGAAGGIGIHKAFQIEGVEEQFGVLFNNTELGKKRVKELIDLAAKTPFDLGPWLESARLMRQTGGDKLDNNDFLTKMGDAAAVTKQDVQQVSVWTAKLYNSLKSGSGVGVSGDDMMRAGVIRPETYARLKKIGTETANFGEAWKLVYRDFSRFEGGMERFSKTGSGMLGIFRGLVSVGMAQMFEGVGKKFKDVLDQINQKLKELYEDGTFTKWGEKIASGVKKVIDSVWQVVQAWKNLNQNTRSQLINIGGVLSAVLVSWKAGFLVPLMKGITGLVVFAITHAGLILSVMSGIIVAIAGFKLGRALIESSAGSMFFVEAIMHIMNASFQALVNGFQLMIDAAGVGWNAMKAALRGDKTSGIQFAGGMVGALGKAYAEQERIMKDLQDRINAGWKDTNAKMAKNPNSFANFWKNLKKEFSVEGFTNDIESALDAIIPQSVKDFLKEIKNMKGIEFPKMEELKPLTGKTDDWFDDTTDKAKKLKSALEPIRGIYARLGRLPRPALAVNGAQASRQTASPAASESRTVAVVRTGNSILSDIRDNTKSMKNLKLGWA